MTKKITFATKPLNRPTPDQWVSEQPTVEAAKRLTIDVSPALHKRIKMRCAAREQKMADVIREILETQFPVE